MGRHAILTSSPAQGLGGVVTEALLFVLIFDIGCEGSRLAKSGDGSISGDALDAPELDSASFELGRETIGIYNHILCCAPGEGSACCGDERTPGTCFPFGGLYGDCRPHGAELDGKLQCAHCCHGLSRVTPDVLVEGNCRSPLPPSAFICINCGDGICSSEENHCRCPGDCP